MADAVRHRGPDADGQWVSEPAPSGSRVGFAHRRLAIIDLSPRGRQPMAVACPACAAHGLNDLALTYNGEIYNYRELAAELRAEGHRFVSDTDSEVLLHLYARDGLAMLERLNGIFAFAIRDGRERGRPEGIARGDVLIARDPLGVKPLYLAELREGLLFASEIKALLRSRAVPRDIDLEALHYHLAYLWAPAPHTMLRAVRKMEPGHAVVVRDGVIAREWRYYDLPYGSDWLDEPEERLAERLAAEVEAAVARQMVADVPVGAFLSGGLDSSAVVAMMRRVRPGYRPRCYSIGFRGDRDVDGSPADLPYARRVAAHLGADLSVLEIEPDAIRHLPRMLYHLDEPQGDPAPINALLIAEQARRDGTKVLLSGAGGDDIFSGYRRHRALELERRWTWMPRPVVRGLAATARWIGNGGSTIGAMRRPAFRRAAKAFVHADLSPSRRMASYFWWSGESTRRGLYTPELNAATLALDTAAPLTTSLARIPTERDPLNRMLYLEAKHFLADHNLNYTDKVSMAAGVEVRVPLLDLQLVAFATQLPPNVKQRGAVGKAIFKRAMEPYLPADVIYRPKTGFGAPLRRWMHDELRDIVEDALSPESLARRGWFAPPAVRSLLARDRAGAVDATYTLFTMVCVELWCRMFVDASVPMPPTAA